MTRPLLITDCDEVLLHMVSHFGDWVRDVMGYDFDPGAGDFSNTLKHRDTGKAVAREDVWPLLDQFFETEMHRQTLVPGAREALAVLSEQADIVVLTNLGHHFNAARAIQLTGHGITHRVETNQGGKGDPVARLVAEFAPSVTVFVDDLAHHHTSVAKHAPEVWRLHMIAEPFIAERTPAAAHAHVRIDDWGDAVGWIEGKFNFITSFRP